MTLALACVSILLFGVTIFVLAKRKRERDELQRISVTPEMLHLSKAHNQEIVIFDVRQPLDLLAYPEIIPGARRIPPEEVLERLSLIPKDKDTVVYCTCPDDKTSRTVMQRARAAQLNRVKFLEGGLAAWKAKGYPVEPYREVFHLYRTAAAPSGSSNQSK
jgi:rhodanese-related sulfurtransferase